MITLTLGFTHCLVIILKELDDNPQVGVHTLPCYNTEGVG